MDCELIGTIVEACVHDFVELLYRMWADMESCSVVTSSANPATAKAKADEDAKSEATARARAKARAHTDANAKDRARAEAIAKAEAEARAREEAEARAAAKAQTMLRTLMGLQEQIMHKIQVPASSGSGDWWCTFLCDNDDSR